MAYITIARAKGTNYYSLSESVRTINATTPRQTRQYLGKYQAAIKKLRQLNIREQDRERFIEKIITEESKSNKNVIVFPGKTYKCIVIDPPWHYRLRNNDASHRNKVKYPTMQTKEILALPIRDICNPVGTVLWLWFTNSHMLDAAKCIEAWGFELKTILTWHKVSKEGNTILGMGHWLRNSTEHCILAIKGQVTSFSYNNLLTNQSTVLMAQRREHSRKPNRFYTLVEQLCPDSKIELFAREKRPGWDVWGNEVDKFS